jgi:hypothetical protein
MGRRDSWTKDTRLLVVIVVDRRSGAETVIAGAVAEAGRDKAGGLGGDHVGAFQVERIVERQTLDARSGQAVFRCRRRGGRGRGARGG